MPIRNGNEPTTVGANGAKFASADGGIATFTIDPADGGANITYSVHAGGVLYPSTGDVVTCNGIYTYTAVAL